MPLPFKGLKKTVELLLLGGEVTVAVTAEGRCTQLRCVLSVSRQCVPRIAGHLWFGPVTLVIQ